MNSVTLYLKEGRSDKVYQAAIEPRNSLYVVTFAYGRRGTTLQTGMKTPIPVDFSTATTVFEKLVKQKTAKGYTHGESGTPYEGAENANAVSGILPQLLNSIEEAVLYFAKSPLWCMQEKMDGRRLLIKKEGCVVQGINRRGLVCAIPLTTLQEANEIEQDFIIDGEIVGEVFHAFDFLSCDKTNWTVRPYRDRLNGLEVLLADGPTQNIRKIETFYQVDQKLGELDALRKSDAEGVVFKLLSAPYSEGRPAAGGPALKYKFTATGSFIVEAVNGGRSVRLKLFQEEKSCGNVTIPPNHPLPEVGAVVEVRYLYAFRGGSLYQPVYLGERDDIVPEACVIDQLKFKPEEEDDDQ